MEPTNQVSEVVAEAAASEARRPNSDDPNNHPLYIFDSANPTSVSNDELGSPPDSFSGPGIGAGAAETAETREASSYVFGGAEYRDDEGWSPTLGGQIPVGNSGWFVRGSVTGSGGSTSAFRDVTTISTVNDPDLGPVIIENTTSVESRASRDFSVRAMVGYELPLSDRLSVEAALGFELISGSVQQLPAEGASLVPIARALGIAQNHATSELGYSRHDLSSARGAAELHVTYNLDSFDQTIAVIEGVIGTSIFEIRESDGCEGVPRLYCDLDGGFYGGVGARIQLGGD
ncbi:hypothetical protein V0U79_10775 [Hyphobacterium sp. HN65]|uniref:TonB-dependent receptor-like beta-barrel domain-containing protein n=1 Tax=Hyphobacterium lacteum TaxID=3116575 RepID=A0ABU7LSG1_9PROT|nr:hypothetical protein [Hyphobacterium sp. HN65]MEE2526855.1 hypothetical protein [Hyphobacterium sp. HN65]